MSLINIIGIIGVFATLLGVGVGFLLGRRAEFAVAEWMRELRSWSAKVIKLLSQASYGIRDKGSEDIERVIWAQDLSALIEIGRFYLPNQRQDEHGQEKPLAYRGYRHAALDPLVAAIRVLEQEPKSYKQSETKILLELRREYVSAMFQILGPEHYNKEIGRIIKTSHRSRRDDLTIGGLLPGDEIPSGATVVLEKVISKILSQDETK